VVGIYDGTSWKLYFDGIQKTSIVTEGPESNARDVFIGAFDYYLGTQRFFNGKIDEVRIYSRALGDGEVLDLYRDVRADINNNGNVDILDLGEITSRFGLRNGDSGWADKADVAADGEIDIFDMVFVASRFT
jgi:hypothetical protein